MHGASLFGNRLLWDLLLDTFRDAGIQAVTENVFPAVKQHTVTRFCVEELGVPAVQLELNHRFRAPNRNGADYARMFRALAAVIASVRSVLG